MFDVKRNTVVSNRGVVVEEYSSSSDGIRQDFIINTKPDGDGNLVLSIQVDGADISEYKDGISLKLNNRCLKYHKVNVSDALGVLLNAKMKVRINYDFFYI